MRTNGEPRRVLVTRLAVPVAIVIVELIVTVAGTWTFVTAAGRVVDVEGYRGPSTALVLGSLVTDGEPGSYVRGRLDTALDLYRTGRIARIINSGNGSAGSLGEPAVMRSYLTARGVPDEVMVDDPAGFDTERSCRQAREVFGARSVVVVTQDFHLDRAIALCRARGLDTYGITARCDCPAMGIVRNHLREALLSRPRALLSAIVG